MKICILVLLCVSTQLFAMSKIDKGTFYEACLKKETKLKCDDYWDKYQSAEAEASLTNTAVQTSADVCDIDPKDPICKPADQKKKD